VSNQPSLKASDAISMAGRAMIAVAYAGGFFSDVSEAMVGHA
jgi:hypothetical protein